MDNATSKRNTKQKAAIERVVLSSCDHPSAETVCERVRKELPSVSLGTVYRVLKALALEGRIREISLPNAPSRFDKTTDIHAHFVCLGCGSVTDVNAEESEFLSRTRSALPDWRIEEADIVFKGLCPNCKEIKL